MAVSNIKTGQGNTLGGSMKTGIIIAAVVVATFLLTLILPRSEGAGYFYSEGEPWNYSALIAKSKFPVMRTEAEIKATKDSIRSQFSPYFALDRTRVDSAIATLHHDAAQLPGIPSNYVSHVEKCLKAIYDAGLLSLAEHDNVASTHSTTLRVADEKNVDIYDLDKIYNERTAYDYIMNADSARYDRAILSRFELSRYLQPNIRFDREKSEQELSALLATVSNASGGVLKGEKIIDRGDIVTPHKKKLIDSYMQANAKQASADGSSFMQQVAGQALFVLTMLLVLLVFLYFFNREALRSTRSILLIFSLVTLFPIVTHALMIFSLLNVYIVPFALVAIFTRIFYNSSTAFVTFLVTVLLASLCMSNPYDFVLIELMGGIVAIFTVTELTERSELLRITLLITLVSLGFALVIDLTHGTPITSLSRFHYFYIAAGGIMLLCAVPLLYLLERVFGFSSSMTMIELMNINNKILSSLSQTAQGTFNHSMNVANLATDVAKKIGGRVQLVRCGAFYHDIGKMANPTYFTENQSGVNPHDKLADEKQSAAIIISHVTEGIRIAHEHNLPKEITDFILTHHGRGKVKYFYIQWKNAHPGTADDESAFTYPGPNPQTKEQAILMMCDAVEAAARSLSDYTPASIGNLVSRIIDSQLQEGFFNRCPVSFVDIEIAKRTLVESLKKMYHTRVSYPELEKSEPAESPQS